MPAKKHIGRGDCEGYAILRVMSAFFLFLGWVFVFSLAKYYIYESGGAATIAIVVSATLFASGVLFEKK